MVRPAAPSDYANADNMARETSERNDPGTDGPVVVQKAKQCGRERRPQQKERQTARGPLRLGKRLVVGALAAFLRSGASQFASGRDHGVDATQAEQQSDAEVGPKAGAAPANERQGGAERTSDSKIERQPSRVYAAIAGPLRRLRETCQTLRGPSRMPIDHSNRAIGVDVDERRARRPEAARFNAKPPRNGLQRDEARPLRHEAAERHNSEPRDQIGHHSSAPNTALSCGAPQPAGRTALAPSASTHCCAAPSRTVRASLNGSLGDT